MEIEMNLYKIKTPEIKKLFLWEPNLEIFNNQKNLFKVISNEYRGVFVNNNVYSLYPPKEEEFLFMEEINFESLDINIKERLLTLYFKYENKIYEKINSKIKSLVSKNEHYRIYRYLNFEQFRVININGENYISLNISHKILPTKTLIDLYKEDPIYVEKIEKARRKDNLKVVNIKRFLVSTHDGYMKAKNLIQKKLNEKEISLYMECFEKNYPIVDAFFNSTKESYYFTLCQLMPYIEVSNISSEDKEKISLSNYKKKVIIENAIKDINEIYKKPLKKKFVLLKIPERITDDNEKLNKLKDTVYVYKRDPDDKKYIAKIAKVPKILKNKTINIYLFIDKNLREKFLSLKKNEKKVYIAKIIGALKRSLKTHNISVETNQNDFFFNLKDIYSILSYLQKEKEKEFKLVLTVGKEGDIGIETDYYKDLKRLLLESGFIHQNIIWEHIVSAEGKFENFEIVSLIYQILIKMGIYPYLLKEKFPFDYIVGIDVGNDEYGVRNVGGGIAVINGEGILEKLIPVYSKTKGEKVNLKDFIEILLKENNFNMNGKRILVLKDGLIYNDELKNLASFISNFNFKITILNTKKNNEFVILDNFKSGIATEIKENLFILKSHNHKKGGRCLKIDNKWVFNNGKFSFERINYEDIEILHKLTYLNYSTPYKENLKLPAPLHYAHLFVNALRKGWIGNNELVKEGALYFI